MVIGPDFSRGIRETDYDAVDSLLRAAFPTDAEARLVRQLRNDGDMWLEVVTPWMDRIGGYYALSRMRAPKHWVCLAPVAVWPEFQNGKLAERNPNMVIGSANQDSYRRLWRFGSRMMQTLSDIFQAPNRGPDLPDTIVVLGKMSFYERAGFSQKRAAKLTSPYPIEHTLILRAGDDVPQETLIYPKAFEALE